MLSFLYVETLNVWHTYLCNNHPCNSRLCVDENVHFASNTVLCCDYVNGSYFFAVFCYYYLDYYFSSS